MVAISHNIRLFLDTLVLIFWGRSTFDLIKDYLSDKITIHPINDFMSFMFSFVGLCYFIFRLIDAINQAVNRNKSQKEDIRRKKIENDKLENK